VTKPGDALHLTFWLKVNGDEGRGKNKGPQSSIQVQLGGVTLFSATNLSPGNYTQYAFDTTATGSSTNLIFTFSNQHNFFHLDDVSIQRTASGIGTASVNTPEPASLTLAAVGLFGVAVAARRRRPA
jgi:MYXO-CTERM domain-containing protein